MDIGPVLPPHLAQKSKQLREQESTKDEEKVQGITENEKYLEKRDEEKSDEDESYGPALPPGFPKREGHCSNSRIIGPMRPQFSEHHVAPIKGMSSNVQISIISRVSLNFAGYRINKLINNCLGNYLKCGAFYAGFIMNALHYFLLCYFISF